MTRLALRHELLRLQKRSYARKLRIVQESFADPPYVLRYAREYLKSLRGYERVATRSELFRRAQSVDIVYQGDYHTLRHSQRGILALLQALSAKKAVILCLEMFHASDQKWLDLYQDGKIEEGEFLQRIRYDRKWAYNFNPWRVILQYCRDKHIPVYGINAEVPTGPHALRLRDRASAQVIAKALIKHAPAIVHVVDGDYHIAPEHLPKQVEKLLSPLGMTCKRLLLDQNVEKLYWLAAQRGEEEAQVLKISEDRYCLMNTVPATKLQSFIDWLDYAEDGYFPVKGEWAELGGEEYLPQILNLVRELTRLLQIDLPKESLRKLTVFSSRNLDFGDRIRNHPALKSLWPRLREKIVRDEGFLLEFGSSQHRQFWIYLPNASVNQAAEEASHFVHAFLRGTIKPPGLPFDRFYQTVMTEALGFFGSKLFNEKRKAPTETRLRRFLGRVKKGEVKAEDGDLDLARRLLQHLHFERHHQEPADYVKKFASILTTDSSQNQALATQLGYILGNRLYYAGKSGQMELGEIRVLFHRAFDQPGEAFQAYLQWSKSLHHLPSSSP